MKLTETETNKLMLEYLLRTGCFVWRNNTGAMKAHGRVIHYGKVGSGDIIGLTRNGLFISVENKSNGEPISDAQRQFAADVTMRNGVAVFVNSLDDLIEQTRTLEVCKTAEECGL